MLTSYMKKVMLKILMFSSLIFIVPLVVNSCDEPECSSGQCRGSDGKCYSCTADSYCTTTPVGNCSTPTSGVYCCTTNSGGGGCTPTGCPPSSPWLCGSLCYTTPPSGNHSCIKCP